MIKKQATNLAAIRKGDGIIAKVYKGDTLRYNSAHSITYNLDGIVTPSQTKVKHNAPFTLSFTTESGKVLLPSTVMVTMGGTDITSTAYNSTTGQISIASVTGNVVINAIAQAYVTHAWIESDASGTIDTGYVPTGRNIKIVAKFNVLEYKTTVTWLRIMCAYTGESYNAYAVRRWSNGNNSLYAMCGNRANAGKQITNFSLNTIYEMEMTFSQIKLNGVTTSLNSTTGSTNTGKFIVSNANVKLRLWSLKIYDNNVLKVDLVPTSLGTINGVIDTVSGKFIQPSTSGFVCGD